MIFSYFPIRFAARAFAAGDYAKVVENTKPHVRVSFHTIPSNWCSYLAVAPATRAGEKLERSVESLPVLPITLEEVEERTVKWRVRKRARLWHAEHRRAPTPSPRTSQANPPCNQPSFLVFSISGMCLLFRICRGNTASRRSGWGLCRRS